MPASKPVLPVLLLLTGILLFGESNAFGRSLIMAGHGMQSRTAVDTSAPECSKSAEIEKIINDAISLGAPIYNEGMHMACYRIYEWAAYKILYEYGKDCRDVEKILKSAIDKSHGDYSDTEKAWMMRVAFDKVLGVPTRTGAPEKDNGIRKGK